MRLVGLEELARMRLEDDGAGRPAVLPRLARGRRDQRLVTPVHAVEVADGQHATSGRGRDVLGTVDNDHDRILGFSDLVAARRADRFRLPHMTLRGTFPLNLRDSAWVIERRGLFPFEAKPRNVHPGIRSIQNDLARQPCPRARALRPMRLATPCRRVATGSRLAMGAGPAG